VTNAPANIVPLFYDYRKAFYVVFFALVNVNDKFISLNIKLGMVEFLPIKKKSLRRQTTLDGNGIISQVSNLHDTKIKTQNADKINLTT